jgi:hypothetical protein
VRLIGRSRIFVVPAPAFGGINSGGDPVIDERRDTWIPAFERVKKSGSGSTFGVIAAPSQGRHDCRQPLADRQSLDAGARAPRLTLLGSFGKKPVFTVS